ncbi:MAG: DUF397 domain-containing protein [Pseudonocardia sp.]
MTAQRPMHSSTIPTFERGQFRKSTRSGQDPQRCVEVARADGWVAVRDSKQSWNSSGDHRLVFTDAQFDSWIASLHTDPAGSGCIQITRDAAGTHEFRSTVAQEHDHSLAFTDEEIVAFLDGARDGEFTS